MTNIDAKLKAHLDGRAKSGKSRRRTIPSNTYYQADFETTTDPEDCRVWGWGLCRIGDKHAEIGTDIFDFMERMDAENSVAYFHNLKFDGGFIIYYLLTHDYVWTDERKLQPGEFNTLIDDMGKFYTIKFRFPSGCIVELRDSYKKLPMTVERIGKSFGTEVLKGEIDYHAERPIGHYPTPEERKYIENDVVIPATALDQQFSQGMKKLTVGSDALAEYRKTVGDKYFHRHFPVFPLELDNEFRRAYRGGFTFADPRFSGRITRGGKCYDVNSLYPSVMYNAMLPYGEPEYVEGAVEPTASHPLTIFSVTVTARLKRAHIPCIQIKGSSMFAPTVYQTEITEPTTLMMTNVDFTLYSEHYNIQVLSYNGGWRFRAKVGMFQKFIDKWSEIKANSTGGMRELSKLMLNSLYGKFATNPLVTGKMPILKDGHVSYKRLDDDYRDPVYTPMGVFITSYARDLTIRAAQQHYDCFAYADTDSLHLLCDHEPELLDVHPTKLGAWKHEYDFDAAFYIRAKAYLERHSDGTYTNRIAGLPERLSGALTFDHLTEGAVVEGKLTPKNVPGGIVLVETPFKLKLS